MFVWFLSGPLSNLLEKCYYKTLYELKGHGPIFLFFGCEITYQIKKSIHLQTLSFSSYSYCDGVLQLYNQSQVLDNITTLVNESVNCNADYVNHLLMDIQIVLDMDLYELVSEGAVESITLTTAGGLCTLHLYLYKNNFVSQHFDLYTCTCMLRWSKIAVENIQLVWTSAV